MADPMLFFRSSDFPNIVDGSARPALIIPTDFNIHSRLEPKLTYSVGADSIVIGSATKAYYDSLDVDDFGVAPASPLKNAIVVGSRVPLEKVSDNSIYIGNDSTVNSRIGGTQGYIDITNGSLTLSSKSGQYVLKGGADTSKDIVINAKDGTMVRNGVSLLGTGGTGGDTGGSAVSNLVGTTVNVGDNVTNAINIGTAGTSDKSIVIGSVNAGTSISITGDNLSDAPMLVTSGTIQADCTKTTNQHRVGSAPLVMAEYDSQLAAQGGATIAYIGNARGLAAAASSAQDIKNRLKLMPANPVANAPNVKSTYIIGDLPTATEANVAPADMRVNNCVYIGADMSDWTDSGNRSDTCVIGNPRTKRIIFNGAKPVEVDTITGSISGDGISSGSSAPTITSLNLQTAAGTTPAIKALAIASQSAEAPAIQASTSSTVNSTKIASAIDAYTNSFTQPAILATTFTNQPAILARGNPSLDFNASVMNVELAKSDIGIDIDATTSATAKGIKVTGYGSTAGPAIELKNTGGLLINNDFDIFQVGTTLKLGLSKKSTPADKTFFRAKFDHLSYINLQPVARNPGGNAGEVSFERFCYAVYDTGISLPILTADSVFYQSGTGLSYFPDPDQTVYFVLYMTITACRIKNFTVNTVGHRSCLTRFQHWVIFIPDVDMYCGENSRCYLRAFTARAAQCIEAVRHGLFVTVMRGTTCITSSYTVRQLYSVASPSTDSFYFGLLDNSFSINVFNSIINDTSLVTSRLFTYVQNRFQFTSMRYGSSSDELADYENIAPLLTPINWVTEAVLTNYNTNYEFMCWITQSDGVVTYFPSLTSIPVASGTYFLPDLAGRGEFTPGRWFVLIKKSSSTRHVPTNICIDGQTRTIKEIRLDLSDAPVNYGTVTTVIPSLKIFDLQSPPTTVATPNYIKFFEASVSFKLKSGSSFVDLTGAPTTFAEFRHMPVSTTVTTSFQELPAIYPVKTERSAIITPCIGAFMVDGRISTLTLASNATGGLNAGTLMLWPTICTIIDTIPGQLTVTFGHPARGIRYDDRATNDKTYSFTAVAKGNNGTYAAHYKLILPLYLGDSGQDIVSGQNRLFMATYGSEVSEVLSLLVTPRFVYSTIEFWLTKPNVSTVMNHLLRRFIPTSTYGSTAPSGTESNQTVSQTFIFKASDLPIVSRTVPFI